ncbi:hypothetical protein ACFL2Q_11300 [Thermodesulfobacteriota bacterium]
MRVKNHMLVLGVAIFLFAVTVVPILYVLTNPPPAGRLIPTVVSRPVGGAPAPKSLLKSIRLDKADVTIRLEEAYYAVDAVFYFFNTGETTTEWVGFPWCVPVSYGSTVKGYDFKRFHTWINGRPVVFQLEQDLFTSTKMSLYRRYSRFFKRYLDYEGWLGHQVRFDGHAATNIRCTYDARYTATAHTLYAEYNLDTASSWKDNVRVTSFTVDATRVGGTKRLWIGFGHLYRRRLTTQNSIKIEALDLCPSPNSSIKVGVRRKWRRVKRVRSDFRRRQPPSSVISLHALQEGQGQPPIQQNSNP